MRRWADVLPEEVAVQQTRWERNAKIRRLYQDGYYCRQIGEMLGLSTGRITQIVWKMRRPENLISPIEKYLKRCEPWNPKAPRKPKKPSWKTFVQPQPGFYKRCQIYQRIENERYQVDYWHWLYHAPYPPSPKRYETTQEYLDRLLLWSDKAMESYAAMREREERYAAKIKATSPEIVMYSAKLAREALRKTYLRRLHGQEGQEN